MRKFLILYLLAFPVHAETLAAHALVCDSASDLEAAEQLVGNKQADMDGKALLAQVQTQVKFFADMHRAGELLGNEAEQEERIGSTYGYPVNSGAQAQNAHAMRQQSDDNEARGRLVLTHCLATDHEQQAEVLERRAIAGHARIRTDIKGRSAEVWTDDRFVTNR